MERQNKKNIKEYLLGVVSSNTEIDVKDCSKVIEWVYNEAKEQVRNTNSIEISGFGTYLIYPSKLKRLIVKREKKVGHLEANYEKHKETQYRETAIRALEYSKSYLKYLYEQLDRVGKTNPKGNKECSTDSRGNSECSENGEEESSI